jgi:hypothetical protein
MSDPSDVIMAAIHSAFDSYPKEGDPEWRSPNWIMPEECAHLTKMIIAGIGRSGLPDREEANLTPAAAILNARLAS